MNIDFSAISSCATYAQDKEKLKITGKQRGMRIWFYIILALTVVAWPYLIYEFIKYLRGSRVSNEQRNTALKEFASKNGFTFESNEGKTLIPNKPIRDMDLPFNTDFIIHVNSLRGTFLGYKFTYSLSSVFIKPSGGESSQWPSIIFSLELPVVLPKLFINSKSNNLPDLDAEAVNFKVAQNHELEGDFPNYYDVRIEKNEEIDMYTILTPEVMDALKNNNQYDVWLNGRQLMFITFGDIPRYFAGTPVVFKNAEMLTKEIDKIARALRH